MKHHPIALIVDFQFTSKLFSLFWRSYRILAFVVHSSPRSTEAKRRSSEKSGPAIEILYRRAHRFTQKSDGNLSSVSSLLDGRVAKSGGEMPDHKLLVSSRSLCP